jgi:hypothetical protein
MNNQEIAAHIIATVTDSTLTVEAHPYDDGQGVTLLITPKSKLMVAISNAIKITVPYLAGIASEQNENSTVEFDTITESGAIVAVVRNK